MHSQQHDKLCPVQDARQFPQVVTTIEGGTWGYITRAPPLSKVHFSSAHYPLWSFIFQSVWSNNFYLHWVFSSHFGYKYKIHNRNIHYAAYRGVFLWCLAYLWHLDGAALDSGGDVQTVLFQFLVFEVIPQFFGNLRTKYSPRVKLFIISSFNPRQIVAICNLINGYID